MKQDRRHWEAQGSPSKCILRIYLRAKLFNLLTWIWMIKSIKINLIWYLVILFEHPYFIWLIPVWLYVGLLHWFNNFRGGWPVLYPLECWVQTVQSCFGWSNCRIKVFMCFIKIYPEPQVPSRTSCSIWHACDIERSILNLRSHTEPYVVCNSVQCAIQNLMSYMLCLGYKKIHPEPHVLYDMPVIYKDLSRTSGPIQSLRCSVLVYSVPSRTSCPICHACGILSSIQNLMSCDT